MAESLSEMCMVGSDVQQNVQCRQNTEHDSINRTHGNTYITFQAMVLIEPNRVETSKHVRLATELIKMGMAFPTINKSAINSLECAVR